MIELTDNLKISIVVILVTGYLIYEQKPECFFTSNGEFKGFGLKPNETPFPFFMVITLIGFMTYYGLILKEGKYV
tara:strand:+ start:203 stop:427 length:225 start_codon:yes stop_codon:yes gene_type:complete